MTSYSHFFQSKRTKRDATEASAETTKILAYGHSAGHLSESWMHNRGMCPKKYPEFVIN